MKPTETIYKDTRTGKKIITFLPYTSENKR